MENGVKRVYCRNLEWIYSDFNNFVINLEFKEKLCEEKNKNSLYNYVMTSSLSFSTDFPFKIEVKVYKKV